MNTAGLKAFVNGHKTPLAVAGALVVAGAALYSRKRSALAGAGTAGGTTNSSTSGATSTGTYSAYGQTVPYDSTQTDQYNQLQQSIEQLQQLSTTIPVNAAPATSQGYYQRTGTPAIYEALSDGTLKWVDLPTWVNAGKPAPTQVAASDPMWSRVVAGTDAPAALRSA